MEKKITPLQEASAKAKKAHEAYRKAVDEEAAIQSESVDPMAEKVLLHLLSLDITGYRKEFKTEQGVFYIYIAKKRDEKK